MKPASKEEFDAILKAHPLAVPDGFKIVGGYTQTRWYENGREIARRSSDSQGDLYDIADMRFIAIMIEPGDWCPVYRCIEATDKDAAETYADGLATENDWQLIDVLEPDELRNIANMEVDYVA